MQHTYKTLKNTATLILLGLGLTGCYDNTPQIDGIPECATVYEVGKVTNDIGGKKTRGNVERLDLAGASDQINKAMNVHEGPNGSVRSDLITILGENLPYSIVKDPEILPREDKMMYFEGDKSLEELAHYFESTGTAKVKLDISDCYDK